MSIKLTVISKKATFRVQHTFCTFLCRCFARLQRETSRNFLVTRFMEEMSYVLSFNFFTTAHFHFALVAASISHFLIAATKFPCCSSTKKVSPLFLSLVLDLCRPFSRWASLACRPLSLFLSFSYSIDIPPESRKILQTFCTVEGGGGGWGWGCWWVLGGKFVHKPIRFQWVAFVR